MLIRNSALYIVSKLLAGLFGLATTASLTRSLDPHEYGLYGLALVIMALGSMVAFEWLALSFLRFYQARREDPQLGTTFISVFVALVAISAAALFIALLAGLVPPHLAGVSILGLIMIWASSWFELIARIAIAEFQPLQYLKMYLGRSFFIFIGATAAAWLTKSSLWAAVATTIGIFAGAFCGNIPIPRPSWRLFDRDLAREVLVFGIPLAASVTCTTLSDSGTRLLLVHLGSAQALGLYTAASVLVMNTLGFIGTGISSAGYSLVVREVERGDHSAARRQLLANGTLLLAVLAPASLGLALTGNCIATTLVGSKFSSGVALLMPWMAISSFFSVVGMGSYFFQAVRAW
jgi:O-antigen/teichoic acid export membrane protein